MCKYGVFLKSIIKLLFVSNTYLYTTVADCGIGNTLARNFTLVNIKKSLVAAPPLQK